MVIALLLLVLLFLAGLLTTYFQYSPYNKSISSTVKSTSSRVSSSSSYEEKGAFKRDELKGVFATFDKDGDGFITKQELRESLKNIGVSMSEKEVQEMVVKVDSNRDGLIDFEEFSNLCEAMWSSHQEINNKEVVRRGGGGGGGGGDQEGELKEAFDVFDKDKDGLISVEELGSVLSSLGLKEGRRLEDCKEMIKKVDMDGDGMVSFDEFKRMMMKTSGGGEGNKLLSII